MLPNAQQVFGSVMSDASKIVDFICSELASVPDPANPANRHQFPHLRDLSECSLRLIAFDVPEPLLGGLNEKLTGSLSRLIAPQSHESLQGLCQELATGFEGFLKKIAYLRYLGDAVRVHGDGVQYHGLLHTTLGGLLYGQVAKVEKHATNLTAPVVTFTPAQSTIRERVYDQARIARNRIHHAPLTAIGELWSQVRVVVAALLFALDENLPLIRERFDPIFAYLRRTVTAFKQWESGYVALTGEQLPETARPGIAHLPPWNGGIFPPIWPTTFC